MNPNIEGEYNMNMPRFAAEASLYRTDGRHRTVGSFNQAGDSVEAGFGLYD
jgi:hypothetical protein